MKSIINNKKKLNSNNYKKIVITQNKEDIKINVTGELINFPMQMTGVPFTETILSYDKRLITTEVMEYFKRNNVINYIKEGKVKGYDGNYISFGNLYNDRTLSFKLDCSFKENYNSILNKYQEDRIKFLEKHNDITLIKIWEHSKISQYSACQDAELNFNSPFFQEKSEKMQKCLVLVVLAKKSNELIDFDQRFIQDYLYKKIFLADESEEFYMTSSSPYVNYGIIKVKSHNICIELPGHFYEYIQNLLIERKMYLKYLDENQMKLKLEMER